ncbi:RND efflux system, outer membrane lipoprotein,NodT family [Fibrella aestuarina BUZ 2]|uniref:RND efflux system, outer membrane lipoprotein,NodT family n=1 Tax=Fibrella aestuarina BUZ 2 TaxID=1166018 RepID=I0K2A7_9BACT|nr:efflux transporter outer membrane subunit [Fibrella aestuarina]CCG98260.1 RND efflux system, outer membrane lipoprotein,NodT family [Fibrella aestuarina BUZ 2]
MNRLILLFLLTGTAVLAQVSPPGGAVTLQPGAGTVQPSAPATAANVPVGNGASNASAAIDLPTSGVLRFSDPILADLVQLGLTNSPNLRAAVSRIEESRGRIRIAQSFLQPSIRSSALITTQSLSEHRPVAIPTATDRLPRFQLNTFQLLPVDASWELDVFRRIRGGVTVAQLQAQSFEADLNALRLTLAADIARTYYLIRGNEAEQAVFQRNIAARDSTVRIVRERFRVGLVNQIDVQRAETDLAQLRVQIAGLQRARVELVNALAQLTAQDPATFNLATGTLPASVPTFPYANIPPDLLRRRPDLLQAERAIQVADAQLLVQQASTQPRVTLVGSGGVLSGQIASWFVPTSATYLLGVNASVPLYEGRRNRETVALSKQQTRTSQQVYEQTLQVAQREAETALDNLTYLREQLGLQNQTVALARTTEQYNRELYVKGFTTYLEVLDAQRTVLSAEQQAVQLRSQEVQYVVALLRALGGDF